MGAIDSYAGLRTAAISTSGSGDKTIVAAQPGKRWMVFAFYLQTDTNPTNVTVKSGSTAITGPIRINDDFIQAPPQSVPRWCGRAANEALVLNCSSAGVMRGFLVYGMVDA